MANIINLIALSLMLYSTHAYGNFIEDSRTKINSDSLIINYANNTASFYGNVKVTKKNTVLFCEKIIAYKSKKFANTVSTYDIDKIEFFNNISIYDGTTSAKADTGEYNLLTNTITLFNNVSLKENETYLEGDKLIYNLNTKIVRIMSLNQNNNNLHSLQKERIRIYIPNSEK